ncbi:hypothetical protein D9619_013084 [Psilocybe cf. subviscida]|uniref:Reverse transcriptase domain-containing protein n=1 Tax=Psilocybe cf. subviscida TaxID=2480587 RepID=A0A8H5AZV1_9AGAR|nr:hypothetical protein D9619_013084 [Psilocybe cf. subviscida]
MSVVTRSPTKSENRTRKRKANEIVEMSPDKLRARKGPQVQRPTTPTPTNDTYTQSLLVTTQHAPTDNYDVADEDEDMYTNSEETATFENLSVYNHPAILTEEQMINNVALNLQETINMTKIAKEAGFGDILRHSQIASLVNVISDTAYERTLEQTKAMLSRLETLADKMENMEDKLTQNVQKMIDKTELHLANKVEEIQTQVKEKKSTTETYAKVASKQTTKTQENITQPPSNADKKDIPNNPTATYHPSRAVIAYQHGIPDHQKLAPAEICDKLNVALAGIQKSKEIQVVAARYTQHGNIIINTRADQNAMDFVKIANEILPQLHPEIPATARADVKWWKIQVDGVPTHRMTIGGEIYSHTSETVHKELLDCNPGYATISNRIIAKPRWLRTPDELQAIPHSSVVFAVDDEEAAKTLLKNGKLAAFGRYCTLRPFQDRPPVIQCTNCWGWEHKEAACRLKTRCRLCSGAHHEKEHEGKGPCDQCRKQAESAGDTVMEEEECHHQLKCAICALEQRDNIHHAADNRRCPARIEKWGTARANEKKAVKNNEPWKIVKPKTKARDKKQDTEHVYTTRKHQLNPDRPEQRSYKEMMRRSTKTITQPIKIAQLNCQQSKNTVINLLNQHGKDFDIFILQEPAWGFIGQRDGKEIFGPPSTSGWTPILPFSAPKENSRPRTMAYTKSRNDMTVTLRTDIIEHRDIQILDVLQQGNTAVTIINIYNDPRLKEKLNLPSRQPILITGDYNLHHVLWSAGPVGHDRVTDEIVSWLSGEGYTLLNEKGVITHPARNRRERDSVIDLSFANSEATTQDTFKDWCVDPSLAHDSDHYAIRFTIDHGRHEVPNPLGLKYSLKQVEPMKWIDIFNEEIEKVEEILQKLTTQHIEKEDLDVCAETITSTMQNATARVGKELRPSTTAKPWWDEELSNTAKALAEARLEEAEARRQQRTNHQYTQKKIATLRNYFHRQCRKKKKEWAVQKLENANELEIWQFQDWSKGSRNYPTPPIQRGQGMTPAVLHTDKCEALRSELFQPPPQLTTEFNPDLETPINDELPFEDITEEEVFEAIHKNSANTAPGYSQVTYQCIQWAWSSHKGKQYTLLLMRKCLQVGHHPRSWRKAVAVALRKPNKPDYSNPRAYRLITLLECMGKILERIVARRLTYLAGRYDLIPPGQFGGRSSSSTTDALLTFVNDIQSAWNHGYATSALTFDIKGYFDFVNHKRLLVELRRKKVPLVYIKWTASFLEGREAAVCLDGKIGEMKEVQNGIPQGSPISPILAAFYTAELLEVFDKKHSSYIRPHPDIPTDTQLLMYVDDGNLYVSSPSLETNVALLETAYRKVHEWLAKAGLSADLVKRELIHYCKPRSRKHTTSLGL